LILILIVSLKTFQMYGNMTDVHVDRGHPLLIICEKL